jgi:Flp pilus assembly protein TadD
MEFNRPVRYAALKQRWFWMGFGFLVLTGFLGAWIWWGKKAGHQAGEESPRYDPGDPRLTIATPFRNVRPEVKFVGDEACAGCHAEKAKTYRQHPMGRSLASVAEAAPLERFDSAAHNPLDVSNLRYQVERQGSRVWHRETLRDRQGRGVAERAAEVQFAVGSGQRGRAYLINQDGYLFASPLTWYPAEERWDLSPGYERRNPHFGRPITPDCLFCHCNQADPVADTVNRYQEPIFRGQTIGCERCHGPGELHVVERGAGLPLGGPIDFTIVNPRHLSPERREQVCQECHLQGQQRIPRRGRNAWEYRPGLPWDHFVTDFVRLPEFSEGNKFVGTVEQMHLSRCFLESKEPNKLGCTSCHDPHEKPAPDKAAGFYRQRCLMCHKEKGCSLPAVARAEKADDCVGCHLPRSGSNFNHTSISDHRVPRRPEAASRPSGPPAWPKPGQIPLAPFHPGRTDQDRREIERGLGIALIETADGQSGPRARQLADSALPLLEKALADDPRDVPALAARGDALLFQGRLNEALAALEAALQLAPEREVSLARAADLALRLDRPGLARSFWERALRVNPWRWQYHQGLARTLVKLRNWPAAIQACRQVLRLQPAHQPTRQLLITCLVQVGEPDQARAEFEVLLGLVKVEQEEGLKRWFAQVLSRTDR